MTKKDEKTGTASVIDEPLVKQAHFILMEISTLAGSMQQLLVDATPGDEEIDDKRRAANIRACETLAGVVGYLSDLAQEKIGGIAEREGADDWLLSPMYQAWKYEPEQFANLRLAARGAA